MTVKKLTEEAKRLHALLDKARTMKETARSAIQEANVMEDEAYMKLGILRNRMIMFFEGGQE